MALPARVCAAALVIALSGCVRPAPALEPAGPAILAVITWNMHGGRGDLERLVADLAGGRLAGGTPAGYVLLLQEALEDGDRGVRRLAADRRLSLHFSAVRPRDDTAMGNAILASTTLANPRTVDLPRERQRRAAVAADLTIAEVPLFVVSTHLENRLGWLRGLFGDRARGRQAEALLRALPTGGHGIVGGDMNTMLGPDEPAWRALLARFPDTPPDPGPTFRDRLVLDHLFFDLPPGWLARRAVLPEGYGSDHRPVLGLVRRAGG